MDKGGSWEIGALTPKIKGCVRDPYFELFLFYLINTPPPSLTLVFGQMPAALLFDQNVRAGMVVVHLGHPVYVGKNSKCNEKP